MSVRFRWFACNNGRGGDAHATLRRLSRQSSGNRGSPLCKARTLEDLAGPDVAKLVEVARVDDVPLQRGLTVELSRCSVALFNVRGRIFAIDAACVRCASPLAAGDVRGDIVACAGCGWQYDVTTGRLPAIPKLCVDTFEVKIVGSRVMVCDPFAES